MNVNVTYKFHQEFYDKYNSSHKTDNYDPNRPMANCPTDTEIIDGAKECASDIKDIIEECPTESWCHIL